MNARFTILFLLAVLFTACSTLSQKHQVPLTKRVWHDITGRYNGYFNADLKLNNVKRSLKENQKDNYNEVLSVYQYGSKEDARAYYPELDAVIKKASKVIQYHPVSKWVDDSYYLVGQAQYFKGDHADALETFQYVIVEFKGKKRAVDPAEAKSKAKKKKKRTKKFKKRKLKPNKGRETSIDEEQKNEKPFLEKINIFDHEPVTYEAMIWVAKSYTALEEYQKALSVISLAQADSTFPKKLKGELAAAHADLFLQRKDYAAAIAPLEEAIEFTRSNKKKTRYTYILAQIHQELNEQEPAIEQFQEVLSMSPSYTMEFHALMNLAQSVSAASGTSSADIRKTLRKMLKNEKYLEFQDKIYYALAELSLKEENTDEALAYLKKSAQIQPGDREQKAKTYLKIADIYFDKETYPAAKAYYDSTLLFLDKSFDRYSSISERKDILAEVVTHLETISKEDSLQQLALMPAKERDKLITEKIRQDQEAQNKQKQAIQQSVPLKAPSRTPSQAPLSRGGITNPAISTGRPSSTWYFYNPGQKSLGYNRFVETWGRRPLEDNWRRSNKKEMNLSAGEDPEQGQPLPALSKLKEKYYAGIPLTPEQMERSNNAIAEAYFALGTIYKNKLQNDNQAINAFETLISRYPDYLHRQEAYYNLYLLYQEKGDAALAAKYRNILLEQHPESIYAKVIKDPNYAEASKKQENALEAYYSETFELYKQGQYQQALTRIEEIQQKQPKNGFAPKFDLLKALAIGQSKDKNRYVAALHHVVDTYPGDEVKAKAEEILKYLEEQSLQKEEGEKPQETGSIYQPDAGQPHFFIVVLNDLSIQKNDITNAVADFNNKFFSLNSFRISSRLFDQNKQLISVTEFPNKAKALDYFEQAKTEEKNIFPGLAAGDYQYFIISQKNYATLLKEGKLAEYLTFFKENY